MVDVAVWENYERQLFAVECRSTDGDRIQQKWIQEPHTTET